ncbi:hypothetical protein BGZ65_009305, partial [Modicella reniformis]
MDEISGNIEADFELGDKTYQHIIIPVARGSKTCSTFLYCARSIHLLAAAFAYSHHESKKTSTDSSQETITFEAHATAIARFTLGHINRVLSKKDYNSLRLVYEPLDTGEITLQRNNDLRNNPSFIDRVTAARVRSLSFDLDSWNQREQVINIFTLLRRHELRDLNLVFIEGLLKPDGAGWVPHSDMSLNPIASAIENKDDQLLKMLIDYCIQYAKIYHPAYLVPAEQCFAKLLDHYPDIVTDLFRSTSYIPAHNHDYVASDGISTSNKFQDIIDGNKYSVFILRSQLPATTPSTHFFLSTNGDLHHGSESRFPSMKNEQPTHKERNYKIYVSPFQFRPIEPLNKGNKNVKTQRKCLLKRHHTIQMVSLIFVGKYLSATNVEAI